MKTRTSGEGAVPARRAATIRLGGASSLNDWLWASGTASSSTFVDEWIFNHEFGHTLDLRHASEIQADGSIHEYGDQSDFMEAAMRSTPTPSTKTRRGGSAALDSWTIRSTPATPTGCAGWPTHRTTCRC